MSPYGKFRIGNTGNSDGNVLWISWQEISSRGLKKKDADKWNLSLFTRRLPRSVTLLNEALQGSGGLKGIKTAGLAAGVRSFEHVTSQDWTASLLVCLTALWWLSSESRYANNRCSSCWHNNLLWNVWGAGVCACLYLSLWLSCVSIFALIIITPLVDWV